MKFKRYIVTECHLIMYEVYDKNKQSALDMVKNKTSQGIAGLPTQKGFNTLIPSKNLTSWYVTNELKEEGEMVQ